MATKKMTDTPAVSPIQISQCTFKDKSTPGKSVAQALTAAAAAAEANARAIEAIAQALKGAPSTGLSINYGGK